MCGAPSRAGSPVTPPGLQPERGTQLRQEGPPPNSQPAGVQGGGVCYVVKHMHSGAGGPCGRGEQSLGSNPSSATYKLYNFG